MVGRVRNVVGVGRRLVMISLFSQRDTQLSTILLRWRLFIHGEEFQHANT
jgi:hypothetical protein